MQSRCTWTGGELAERLGVTDRTVRRDIDRLCVFAWDPDPADWRTVRASLFASIPGDIDLHGPDECTVRLSADSAELVIQFIAAIAALGRLLAT